MYKVIDIRELYTNTDTGFQELHHINKALNQAAIVAVTDAKGTILSVNEYFCDISKYSAQELIGQNHRILNSNTHPKSFFIEMWDTILCGKVWTGNICNRAKDGSLYWVKTTIVPFLDENGKPDKFISIRVDITDQKKLDKMNYLMHYDELTGLPNRRKLLNDLHKLICDQQHFTLFFLDINRFKIINEQLGHDIGDEFLQYISAVISYKFPNNFYRLHSDEFILLKPSYLTHSEMHKFSEEIFEIFEEMQTIRRHNFYSSISIGISQYPNNAKSAMDIIKYADSAMQEAKKLKGNYYAIFSEYESYSVLKPLSFETKLRNAIKDDAFEVYFQPKYNTALKTFDSMEALIRWNDPELGFVSPAEFITFAEEYGFVWKIDECVVKKVIKQLQQWYDEYGVNLKVAINISATHLAKENFVEKITKLCQIPNVSFNQIELEITETAMLNLDDDLLNKLQCLRKLGFIISIDDFGTGFSCLSSLQLLPINKLKIDRSFISKIETQETGGKMVQSIISLGHALKLQVVAEGVETAKESEFLHSNQCEYLQGYYYCRPLPVNEINNMIEQNKFLKMNQNNQIEQQKKQ